MAYLLDDDAFGRLMRMLAQWESGGAGPRFPSTAQGGFGFAPWHFGKLSAALGVGSSATVRIYRWNGSAWTDSGRDITAYAPPLLTTGTIAQGKWVRIEWHHQARRWYVVSAEC